MSTRTHASSAPLKLKEERSAAHVTLEAPSIPERSRSLAKYGAASPATCSPYTHARTLAWLGSPAEVAPASRRWYHSSAPPASAAARFCPSRHGTWLG